MWVLLGLGVVVGATVVSWCFNELTETEKRKTDQLYEERGSMYSQHAAAREAQQRTFGVLRRKDAHLWGERLTSVLTEHKVRVAEIAEGLESLSSAVRRELDADSTSPFRRQALRQDFCRIEDAKLRLAAYQGYLAFEEALLDRCIRADAVDDLLDLDPAEALLPDAWLYPGKLILLSQAEINAPLERFAHKISFGRDFAQHLALSLPFGNNIPVLVHKQHSMHEKLFYGCVARGILYYKHIIEQEPVQMAVVRSNRQCVTGTLFEELIRVELPVAKLAHKHLPPVPGQRLMVYPDSYDMTLKTNPFQRLRGSGGGRSSGGIGVSELPPPQMGVQTAHPIYISLAEALLEQVNDPGFYQPMPQWQLIDYDLEAKVLILGKSKVRLLCSVSAKRLIATQVIQTGQIQSGSALPFELVLVSDLLDVSELDWAPAFEGLLDFALQMAINKGAMERRAAQAVFMRRWQQVLTYLHTHESVRTIEWTGLLESEAVGLTISLAQMRGDGYDKDKLTMLDMCKEVFKSDKLKPERCFKLERWSMSSGSFVPAVTARHRTSLRYGWDPQAGLEIRARLYADDRQTAPLFRFTIELPNDSLKRQHVALESFFHDRMLEPMLKDILLAPQNYRPLTDPMWENRKLVWQDRLAPSQEVAIKTALQARHLALIQGPPGTGKTTAIVEMLYQLFTVNPACRVLLVSQQNTAVDNALDRFIERYPALQGSTVNVIRIGNKDKVSAKLQNMHFDASYASFIDGVQRQAQKNSVHADEAGASLALTWLALLEQIKSGQPRIVDGQTADEFNTALLTGKNLIGATCVGLASRNGRVDNLEFDIAIVDEAGRATVPELLIPLLRCRKAILIGDHFQLPPSISPLLRSDEAEDELPFIREAFLETSFFELLFNALPVSCKATLREQYRMAPEIGDLVAEIFYTNKHGRTLQNGAGEAYDRSQLLWEHGVYWSHVAGYQSTAKNSSSPANSNEAWAITKALRSLAEQTSRTLTVAVITPYSGQKNLLRERLKGIAATTDSVNFTLGSLSIVVDTVDSFQGSEADIVFYSTVRTKGSLRFLLDKKRLNVACSRAKKHLVFFGHQPFLQGVEVRSGVNYFREIIARSVPFPQQRASVASSYARRAQT